MTATLDDVYAGRASLLEVEGYFRCPLGPTAIINEATCRAYQKRPILSGKPGDCDASFRAPCPADCSSPWNLKITGHWTKRERERTMMRNMR